MTDDHLRVLVSAKAVIFQDGKVTLAKNSRGEWDLPGGKLKDGESIEAALRRELQEELSVELESHALLSAAMHHFYDDILVLVYGCTVTGIKTAAISTEHSEIRGFLLDELPAGAIPSPYLQPIRSWCKRAQT